MKPFPVLVYSKEIAEKIAVFDEYHRKNCGKILARSIDNNFESYR